MAGITVAEQKLRNLIFTMIEAQGEVSFPEVLTAAGRPTDEAPPAMFRRVYSDIMVGIDWESDLEYLTRIRAFPPAAYRADEDTQAAAAACARAAAEAADPEDKKPRAQLAARRFWATLPQ